MKPLIIILLLTVAISASEFADRVIIDKSEKSLQLIKNGKVIKKFHVVFGGNPKGHKHQEGDNKTPEGNYTLNYKNSKSHYYKSIHISYPNKKDRALAKKRGVSPGGAIFIHGQKNGYGWLSFISRFFNWTQGCIALSNDDMDKLWKAIKPGTPIEIKP